MVSLKLRFHLWELNGDFVLVCRRMAEGAYEEHILAWLDFLIKQDQHERRRQWSA